MSNKKIILAVILYNPNETIWDRISFSISEGYCVYVFDNSPNLRLSYQKIIDNQNVRYFTCGSNVGIGLALKVICSTAYFEENEYILYFDQDTVFTKETLRYIDDFIEAYETTLNYISRKLISITFQNNSKRNESKKTFKIMEYRLCLEKFIINSGTLFILKNLQKIGWHDHDFFVDGVDYSYCLKALSKGFKIAVINNVIGIDHIIGQADTSFSIFGYSFLARRYPKYRRRDYYSSMGKLTVRALRVDIKSAFWLCRNILIYAFVQTIIPFIEKR